MLIALLAAHATVDLQNNVGDALMMAAGEGSVRALLKLVLMSICKTSAETRRL